MNVNTTHLNTMTSQLNKNSLHGSRAELNKQQSCGLPRVWAVLESVVFSVHWTLGLHSVYRLIETQNASSAGDNFVKKVALQTRATRATRPPLDPNLWSLNKMVHQCNVPTEPPIIHVDEVEIDEVEIKLDEPNHVFLELMEWTCGVCFVIRFDHQMSQPYLSIT